LATSVKGKALLVNTEQDGTNYPKPFITVIEGPRQGASRLSITTYSITTFSIKSFNIKGLHVTLRISLLPLS
jgi:hypothetical protein